MPIRPDRVLLLTLLAASGCLERREDLRIDAAGSIEVIHRFKGDPGEFAPGRPDRLPGGAPWVVTDEDLPHPDGSGSDHVREARASFPTAAAIPMNFGLAGDPAPLAMHTSLEIERSDRGETRWIFERRYEARAYALRDRIFRRTFSGNVRKALDRGEPLEGELRAEAIRGALAFEREKVGELAERALAAVVPGRATAAVRLAARRDAERALEEAWSPETVEGLIDRPAEEKIALEERFRREALEAAASAGARAVGDASIESKLAEAFERERRVWDATEGLQDETFVLRVTFPAPVVLSDGATLEDGGRTAVFRFGGEDLRDDDLVLRAVAQGGP